MFAVLGCVHGNLEALTAVFSDAERHGARAFYSAGDVVGYGPDPAACVEVVAGLFDGAVMGDFDAALLGLLDGGEDVAFPPSALASLGSAADTLDPVVVAYLRGLPDRLALPERMSLMHGSPDRPRYEYLTPQSVTVTSKFNRVFAAFEGVCFVAHTHVPGVFTGPGSEPRPGRVGTRGFNYTHYSAAELNGFWRLDGAKAVVNVGSVGQPRDGDPRACYVLVDGWDMTFRRVEYDVAVTVAKVHANPDLADFLGDRLLDGR